MLLYTLLLDFSVIHHAIKGLKRTPSFLPVFVCIPFSSHPPYISTANYSICLNRFDKATCPYVSANISIIASVLSGYLLRHGLNQGPFSIGTGWVQMKRDTACDKCIFWLPAPFKFNEQYDRQYMQGMYHVISSSLHRLTIQHNQRIQYQDLLKTFLRQSGPCCKTKGSESMPRDNLSHQVFPFLVTLRVHYIILTVGAWHDVPVSMIFWKGRHIGPQSSETTSCMSMSAK